LSVDLVGSTAFKNSPRSESESRLGPAWANVFVQFYNGFPLLFERTLSGSSLPSEMRPKVVKALGDELLFGQGWTSDAVPELAAIRSAVEGLLPLLRLSRVGHKLGRT
jgi:hypothetical protein